MGKNKLKELHKEIKICLSCPLWINRTKLIPGIYGNNLMNMRRKIMFIDLRLSKADAYIGYPFSEYLEDLAYFMNMSSTDVLLDNASLVTLAKCPIHTENKTAEILDAYYHCRSFLIRQIEMLHPKFIMTFGPVTYRALIQNKRLISRNLTNPREKLELPEEITKIQIGKRKIKIMPNLHIYSYIKDKPDGSRTEFCRRFQTFRKEYEKSRWVC